MLVKLREWFGGLFRKEKERPFIDLATGNIPDPEEFIEYLEVRSKAKSDALNDLPSPESGQLTGTEAEICQVVVDNTILIVMQDHEHRLHGHQQQIDNFDLGRSITELTEVEQSFKVKGAEEGGTLPPIKVPQTTRRDVARA